MAKIEAKIVELTPEQEAERTAKLKAWQAAKAALEAAQETEMILRKEAFAIVWQGDNEAQAGTNRVALGGGWNVKGVRKISYTLEKDVGKVSAVDAAIRALGNEGPFLAGEILKRVYDLSESAYKKLDLNLEFHQKIKTLLDSIITTKDGAPSLEIEEPKAK